MPICTVCGAVWSQETDLEYKHECKPPEKGKCWTPDGVLSDMTRKAEK